MNSDGDGLLLFVSIDEHDEFLEWSRANTSRHRWKDDVRRHGELVFEVLIWPKSDKIATWAKLKWG